MNLDDVGLCWMILDDIRWYRMVFDGVTLCYILFMGRGHIMRISWNTHGLWMKYSTPNQLVNPRRGTRGSCRFQRDSMLCPLRMASCMIILHLFTGRHRFKGSSSGTSRTKELLSQDMTCHSTGMQEGSARGQTAETGGGGLHPWHWDFGMQQRCFWKDHVLLD